MSLSDWESDWDRQLIEEKVVAEMGGEFHAKDGLSFKRLAGANVAVMFVGATVTLDADTWASVVAAMSPDGDTAKTFEAARAFHLTGLHRVRLESPTAI